MPRHRLAWFSVYWARPLDEASAAGVLRQWAADQRSPGIAVEVWASAGAVRYALGSPPPFRSGQQLQLERQLPGLHAVADQPTRPALHVAGQLRASTRHRALRVDALLASRAILAALSAARQHEHLALQVLLGPRRVPLAVPLNSPASVSESWYRTLWYGNGPRVDGEKRAALREKVSDHGFACTVRLGASAATPARERALLLGLLAAVRVVESAGLRLRLTRESPARLQAAHAPWRWPLRLNIGEVLALSGWPVGDDPLPGLAPAHPRLLRAAARVKSHQRVLVQATAPGDARELGLSVRDATQHSHLIGVTGAGKSTLLLNLIAQDLAAGHGVVVIDPKGDLVADVLMRVPGERQQDVVVLDPTDRRAPVGLNPLSPLGDDPELAADAVLAVFRGLYPDAWGPRVRDVLHASLLTLSRRADVSLVMLPLLLTNDGFRRSITHTITDPVALGPFWQWFEGLSGPERQQAIAPVLSRLRALLMRPQLRAVLGQVQPRFDMSQVFTEQKILLVSLAKGRLGPDSAALLGSLAVSRLWQTILNRAGVPQPRRRPVMVYIDEVQDYLHLDTDIADVFAQSRSYGTAWTVAHQYLGQLPPLVRSGLMANARSRVVFNVSEEDARALARGIPELSPEDFTALGRYEVYASLLADGQRTPYASGRTSPPPPAISSASALRQLSREQYGRPLNDIEAGFASLLNPPPPPDEPLGRRPRRQS
jgi:hypothetical protein